MTRLEIKALMAGMIAAGLRASESDQWFHNDRETLAKKAVLDAEEVLRIVEERSTLDDNGELVGGVPQ